FVRRGSRLGLRYPPAAALPSSVGLRITSPSSGRAYGAPLMSNVMPPNASAQQREESVVGMVACLVAVPPVQLERLRQSPSEVSEFLRAESEADDSVRYLEIDKSWNGIHYLLTGHAEGGSGPLSMPVLGGTEFGEDVGYGPARFLLAAQVQEVA